MKTSTDRQTRAHLLPLLLLVAGCATSSSANYHVKYSLAGAANETTELNASAAKTFKEEASEAQQRASTAVKVYFDSMPPELTVANNVVSVTAGDAALLATVELTALWKIPNDTEVLPAIQKAAIAAGADLAFCPRNARPRADIFRCYLVRTGPVTSLTNGITKL